MLVLTPEIVRGAERAFARAGMGAEAVMAAATAALTAGPFSVMQKAGLPPSGDRHDYVSLGTYWWPDPAKPDGRPYLRRDGEVNPQIEDFDRPRLSQTADAVSTLAAAAHLSGDGRFAARAALLLRTWFTDPATAMNPHLRYGQSIPGICDGRCIGIIDTECLARVADGVVLLEAQGAWSGGDRQVLRGWFAAYLDWLVTSPLGVAEGEERNNHGTCYDVQVVALALHLGRTDLAQAVLARVGGRRIAVQIDTEGRQPLELARTKAWTYSLKNLFALLNLAGWGQQLDVAVWGFATADGRGIRSALEWMLPFALGERPWVHAELGGFTGGHLLPALLQASLLPGGERYRDALRSLDADPDDLCLGIMGHCPLGAAGATGGRRGFH